MERQLPQIISEVGFDFSWDERKVWKLDLPIENMPITELTWHFDIPFLRTFLDGFYDLKPSEIIDHPDLYPEEYKRTLNADSSYPIDIMGKNERWVILDGLHRLMKEFIEGKENVRVRKVPKSAVPLIKKWLDEVE